ncbi:MAG: hypothetical protein JWN08_923, partial [Frankiales bacterium]|nr:hypothetical protein [Frankiales bacterium]
MTEVAGEFNDQLSAANGPDSTIVMAA